MVITLILSANTGIGCNGSLRDVALPASRLAWEAQDSSAWRQQALLDSGSRLQTVGDLMHAHKNASDPMMARELDMWNAKADSVGTFLNLAISVIP